MGNYGPLAALTFAALVQHVATMKLHDLANQTYVLEESDCRRNTGKFVDGLTEDLDRSLGYDGMFYSGCLKFVEHNAKSDVPMMAQIEAFGKRCKQALFVGDKSDIDNVDPLQLEAECDRAVYNMDIQFRILGADAMKTPQEFCAVFVDMVLPMDEEPECIRFIEDITAAHSQFVGTSHAWTAIIKKPHFEEAFMQACLENKKLKGEEDGVKLDYGDGAKDCQLKMNRLQAMPVAKHYKHLSKFFADVCPMLGMDLPEPTKRRTPLQRTSRSMRAELFQRAAKLSTTAGSNVTKQRKQKKPFSAVQLLDDSIEGKGKKKSDDRRRSRRRLNHEEATCCDGVARTYEVGLTASAGVAVGYTQIGAEGFKQWKGRDCIFNWGVMSEVCAGVDIGAGLDVGVSAGFFKSYDDIKGRAWFKSLGLCFFGCGGGTLIETKFIGGKEVGKTIDSGGGMGVSAGGGYCEAFSLWERSKRIRRVKKKCPKKGCFPADALMQTPVGRKAMRDLRAGDRVQALDAQGRLIFDDIYFFGHAEADAWMAFVKLELQHQASNASWSLELTADHYIQICETQSCRWEETKTWPAERVLPGHWVWVIADSGAPSVALVLKTHSVPRRGLYNPYTLSGNIIVNGVVSSSHSSWILDPWMPLEWQEYLPAIYQQIFVLGRVVYWLFGPGAADVIGVNNLQEVTEDATWSAHALAVFAIIGVAGQALLSLAVLFTCSKWSCKMVRARALKD